MKNDIELRKLNRMQLFSLVRKLEKELAEWKAKYIDARQSGYAEGLEEKQAKAAK